MKEVIDVKEETNIKQQEAVSKSSNVLLLFRIRFAWSFIYLVCFTIPLYCFINYPVGILCFRKNYLNYFVIYYILFSLKAFFKT